MADCTRKRIAEKKSADLSAAADELLKSDGHVRSRERTKGAGRKLNRMCWPRNASLAYSSPDRAIHSAIAVFTPDGKSDAISARRRSAAASAGKSLASHCRIAGVIASSQR